MGALLAAGSKGRLFFGGGEERQADCFKRERDWLAAFRERAD